MRELTAPISTLAGRGIQVSGSNGKTLAKREAQRRRIRALREECPVPGALGPPGGGEGVILPELGLGGAVLPLLIQGARAGGGENMPVYCPPLGSAHGSTSYCHGLSRALPPNSYVEPSPQHRRVGLYQEIQ